MRIAVYARQSVDKKESLSIETQIESCKNVIEREDPACDIVIYKDKGYSGKNTDRPGLQKLIDEIEQDRIDKVVVYKLDRISRNIVDFYNLYDFMNKHSCNFMSVKDQFDTNTPMGRLLMGILINFAQMERENIQVRVQDSYYARAETDGRWLGGKTPFGFDLSKNEKGVSTLKHNRDIDIVKILFDKYATDTNTSLHKLSKFLNEQYGIIKTATAINNILSNPIYVKADQVLYRYYKMLGVEFLNKESEWTGKNACLVLNKTNQTSKKTIFNDTKEWKVYITNWKGAIDSRTFIVVQERLAQNVSFSRDNTPKGKFKELSGLVKCAKCGRAVKIKGKYGSMSCIGRSELRGVCDVSFRGVRLETLQAQVAVEMQKYLDNFAEKQTEEIRQREAIRKEIKQTELEIDKLLEIAEKSETLAKATLNRIEQKQEKIAELELKLNLGVNSSDKIEMRVIKIVQPKTDFRHINYDSLTDEQKQALLKILVNRILLSEDGTIEIDWKI